MKEKHRMTGSPGDMIEQAADRNSDGAENIGLVACSPKNADSSPVLFLDGKAVLLSNVVG